MDELDAVLIGVFVGLTLIDWVWKTLLFLTQAWDDNSLAPSALASKIRKFIRKPTNPHVASIATCIAVIGLSIRFFAPGWEQANGVLKFLFDLSPELVGIAITVGFIDEVVARNALHRYQKEIMSKVKSQSNTVALGALEVAIENRWLENEDDFKRVKWQGADLRSINLSGKNLTSASLEDAELPKANLQNAWLVSAHLSEANLFGAQLEDANLELADLSKTIMREAHLEGTNFSGANLSGADLRRAKLEKPSSLNLKDTKYTQETEWPEIDGFDPDKLGAVEGELIKGEWKRK